MWSNYKINLRGVEKPAPQLRISMIKAKKKNIMNLVNVKKVFYYKNMKFLTRSD